LYSGGKSSGKTRWVNRRVKQSESQNNSRGCSEEDASDKNLKDPLIRWRRGGPLKEKREEGKKLAIAGQRLRKAG